MPFLFDNSFRGETAVSKVISGKKLQKAIIDNEFLNGGDVSNCDGIKYDFRLDDCILKAKHGVPINYSSFPIEKQGTELVVFPGRNGIRNVKRISQPS